MKSNWPWGTLYIPNELEEVEAYSPPPENKCICQKIKKWLFDLIFKK